MKKYLYVLAALFSGFTANAAVGDTTWVQANVDTLGGYGSYDSTVMFPTSGSYRNIYMIVTIGKYVCPGTPTYCGDWDYTVQNYLMTPGGDSLELGRLITPYANAGAPRTPWGWKQRYVYDVTDYASKLQGSATIRLFFSGYSGGFTANIRFAFISGTPDRAVLGVQRLWRGSYGYGGATSINTHFPAINAIAPIGTESADLKFTVTGHGSDDSGCCEFYSKNYTVLMNGNPVATKAIWRDNCGLNELYPQSGTWVYDRANWCPGAIVYSNFHDLPGVTSGAGFNVGLQFDPFISHGGGLGSYTTEAHLIYHGSFAKVRDASVEDIIAPTNNENHFRENPICSTPTITVKNRGANVINLMTLEYGVSGTPLQTHTWSGNLAPLEMTDIVLPDLTSLHTISGDTSKRTFIARIKTVNGTADVDTTNNIMTSQFVPSPKWDSIFRINFRTNSSTAGSVSESSWKIFDQSNTVVRQRVNLAPNTIYNDTVTLTPGCYRFEINDLGCDGLNWWASVGGGYCYVRKYATTASLAMSGYVSSGTYAHDFGCNYTLNFFTGTPVVAAVTDILGTPLSIEVYPNPAQNMVNIDLVGMQQVNGTLHIVDVMGRLVKSQPCIVAHQDMAITELGTGAYTVLFIGADGNKLQTRLMIVK